MAYELSLLTERFRDTTMSQPKDIGWVEPATPIRGLDHLGVQAPCIALYAQLLPGITNVTDRARYYSFHPWLIRSFEQRYRNHSIEEFRRVLRRAECLFALIAIRHARVEADEDDARHGIGMVGRFTLLRIPENEKAINLDDYAGLEGPNRYFKNRLGGLGQYYFGPLRDLRVLDYTSEQERSLPGYDKVRGSALADAFGSGVPQDAFFRLLEKQTIKWSELDALADFCPCRLAERKAELELLLDLFLARSEAYQSSEAENRRASLALILDLIDQSTPLDGYSLESVFRASTYTRVLSNGKPWTVHSSLARVQSGWGTYEQNELLSLALQALFAAVLGAVEHDHSGRLRNTPAAGDVCSRLLPSTQRFRKRRLVDAVTDLESSLPPLGAWRDDAHELQRGWRILEAGIEADALPVLVEEGVQILLSLLARRLQENPYADFDFEPDHFDAREVHLLSFKQAWQSTWSDMTVDEWVKWLAVHWGVQRHLRVALRKLRGERRDTFRIRPLEQDLRVIEVPAPAATVPRLGKAFQILRDLGLTTVDDDDWPTLTRVGRRELEGCLVS
jgi:hypothetical protein